MSVRNFLRKILLALTLGAHSILGAGKSKEEIEALIYAMHETRIEETISDREYSPDDIGKRNAPR
jgi:hypothetical protein